MTATNTRHYTTLALLTSLALGLRAYQLGGAPVTDEAITLAFAWEYTPWEILTVLPYQQPHPPGYYLLVDGITALGGDLFHVRLTSVLFGAATIPVIYSITRELASPRAGLFASGFLAVSPLHLSISQLARMYALLAFCSALSWWALYRLHNHNTWPTRLTFLGATAVLLYVHWYGWLIPLSQIVWLASRWHTTRTWSRETSTVLGATSLGLPALAWLLPVLSGEPAGHSIGTVLGLPTPSWLLAVKTVFATVLGWQGVQRLFRPALYLRSLPAFTALGLAVGGIAYRNQIPWPPRSRSLAYWLLLPIGLAFSASVFLRPLYRPRYAIGALLALYIIAGIWIDRGYQSPSVRQLAIGLLLLMTIATATQYDTTATGYPEAIQVLEEESEPGDQLVIVGSFSRERAYWLRQIDTPVLAQGFRPSQFDAEPTGQPVWVLRSWSQVYGFDDPLNPGSLGLDGYTIDERHQFENIILYRLVPTKSATHPTSNAHPAVSARHHPAPARPHRVRTPPPKTEARIA